ncbi:MAG: hypothetical protein K1X95_00375 [Acidimicrobiia bacterium]|nr:hypothetical protein [Acidimicrobiia bacterium]
MAVERTGWKVGVSATRIGVGVASFLAPSIAGKILGADLDPGGRLAMRLFGSRDAIIGAGQILAGRHGNARGWYEAAMVVDGLDAVALFAAAARGEIKKPLGVLWGGFALSGLLFGFLAARSADAGDDLEAELAELTAAAVLED